MTGDEHKPMTDLIGGPPNTPQPGGPEPWDRPTRGEV